MYHGSSFLLQQDNKIHIPIIKEILHINLDHYRTLIVWTFLINNNLDKMITLSNYIKSFYYEVRKSVKDEEIKQDISDV